MNKASITDLSFNYSLTGDLDQVDLSISLNSSKVKGNTFNWILRDPEGKVILSEKGVVTNDEIVHSSLMNPRLWWPHDQGDQPLYCSEVLLMDGRGKLLDSKKQRIGFRQIRLVMNEGTWQEPVGFPKSRSNPPITVEINNRRIFCKGTNWVNPEIFPGLITRERYKELLTKAVEANFNLLRSWGGAIVNKESFYELCDEMGIMVWTEFPLACNNYEGTPKYLGILKQEATSIIKRVSQHPSNVIWCGGNELFMPWSRMTDQSLALRLLNSLCFNLDPETPFIPTSPLSGMGHGNYVFLDFGPKKEEVFQVMPRAHNTAYTEFGMPGPSSVDILKQIIPENELFPPQKGTSWQSHHAFGAWEGDTWLMKDLLYEYFGEQKTLEGLVKVGQWLQSEGYKCIFEEARRQKPYCSMALNWCYNEPWPTAANNSLINYPCQPKPAFEAVKASCRPILASARIPKFRWNEGEEFSCDLFLLSDLYKEFPKGKMTAYLVSGDQKIEISKWDYPALEQNKNLHGPTAHYLLPHFDSDRITLSLSVESHPEWNSQYTLIYHPKNVDR
jgi:beta-mannosidase